MGSKAKAKLNYERYNALIYDGVEPDDYSFCDYLIDYLGVNARCTEAEHARWKKKHDKRAAVRASRKPRKKIINIVPFEEFLTDL